MLTARRAQKPGSPCGHLKFNLSLVELSARLGPLSAILLAMAANPSNPVFNHNLFEVRNSIATQGCERQAVASIVKVCVPTQPDRVESALLPTFGQILVCHLVHMKLLQLS